MKKFIALMLVTTGVATSARAQWVVYDPTLHTQSILNTAQEIAKYVEMINNQATNVRLYHVQLPKARIDGVAFQPSTKLLRIEE